ncbi:MAG: S49 family peptidase [Candidatus Latescibacterota bacterium]
MKRWRLAVLIAVGCIAPSRVPADFVPYAARSAFLLGSPGGTALGLLGHANPAHLNYVQGVEGAVAWTDARSTFVPTAPSALTPGSANSRSGSSLMRRDWALFSAAPHVGFSTVHLAGEEGSEHRLALAAGDRRMGGGVGYGWESGAFADKHRSHLVVGLLARPFRWFSTGATVTRTVAEADMEVAADLALRPLGSERLTLFAESWSDDVDNWSAGAVVQVVPGVQIAGRLFEGRVFTVGVHLGAGALGVESLARYRERRLPARRRAYSPAPGAWTTVQEGPRHDYVHAFNTYLVRLGTPERSVLTRLLEPRDRYLKLELDGPVRYRKFPLFDDTRTLAELVVLLRHVRRDPGVAGLAVNLSGLEISQEASYELRSLLQEVRRTGKKLVVYVDEADLPRYHLASVADHLVLDPTGMILLPGFAAGRTYFRGTLDKLGVGFEEWRLFEYKSAFEELSRTEMSPADRQQNQELVEDFYEQTRSDICASRGLTPAAFDTLVNQTTLFLPPEALAAQLVDRVGRWAEMDSIVGDLAGRARPLSPARLPQRLLDLRWGEPPRLAVVYALGVTAMDAGMEARGLAGDLQAVCEDRGVSAVVLRVDSPGGDPLAADLVAEAVRRCPQDKPVVVSQGQVAASGGYWVSMYADTIVAAPNTITGSIGVIGGWVYDRGLKERAGIATDHVQVGEHADLLSGASLLGLTLPDRNLRPDERARVDRAMLHLYRDFVARVAQGRRSSPEAIEAVAQGRVWSGLRARDRGLVDALGGMDLALELARQRAAIPADDPVELVEYPRMGLFDPGLLRPDLPLVVQRAEALRRALEFRLEHNGQPLPLLPSDLVDLTPDY